MNIIHYRKIYFAISGLLIVASLSAFSVYGLNLGIDFTGGSLMEIRVDDRIETSPKEIESFLVEPYDEKEPLLDSAQIQPTGEHGFMLRFFEVSEEEHQKILVRINNALVKKLPEEKKKDNIKTSENSKTEEQNISNIQAVDAQGNPVDIQFETEDQEGVISSPVTTIGGEIVVEEMRFESIGPIIGEELKDK